MDSLPYIMGQTYLGGFVGKCEGGGAFENCYAAGDITLKNYPYNTIVGGVVLLRFYT